MRQKNRPVHTVSATRCTVFRLKLCTAIWISQTYVWKLLSTYWMSFKSPECQKGSYGVGNGIGTLACIFESLWGYSPSLWISLPRRYLLVHSLKSFHLWSLSRLSTIPKTLPALCSPSGLCSRRLPRAATGIWSHRRWGRSVRYRSWGSDILPYSTAIACWSQTVDGWNDQLHRYQPPSSVPSIWTL